MSEGKVRRYNVVQRWLGHDHAVLEREYVDHGDSVDFDAYASLAAEAERLRAEFAQAQADARRFVLLIDQLKPDEINHVDLHEAAAQIAADIGPYDAPTDEDYLNAARAAIDSALSNQRGEKAREILSPATAAVGDDVQPARDMTLAEQAARAQQKIDELPNWLKRPDQRGEKP